MMPVEITEENIEEFAEYLGEDTAENVGRDCIRALALREEGSEGIRAALLWELKNREAEDQETEASLAFLRYQDRKAGEELLTLYGTKAGEEKVAKSFAEMEAPETEKAELLVKAGFSVREAESRDLKVLLGDFAMLAAFQKNAAPYVTPIRELMVRQFRSGIANCLFHGRRGLLEDLAFLPMNWYEQDISCCVLSDGKVRGFLLIHKTPSGVLVPELLFATGPDARVDLLNMIRFSVKKGVEKFPPDTLVRIRRDNKAITGLTEKMFPGFHGADCFFGERKEKI